MTTGEFHTAKSIDCEQSLIFLCKVIPYCNLTSWFAIALAEIRTRRISRQKRTASRAKQSTKSRIVSTIKER